METFLMNYVNHDHRTCHGSDQPQRRDYDRSNYGSPRSDSSFLRMAAVSASPRHSLSTSGGVIR